MSLLEKYILKAKRHLLDRWTIFRFDASPYIEATKNKNGIEIGGPSKVFKKGDLIPLYPVVYSLDNCNFSNSTVWEGELKEGLVFDFGDRKGYQYIREASNLHGIESENYDFLLSSHCLEHCANAIATLKEWARVVKPAGYLLVIVPNRADTFDHIRPLTPLSHFIMDEKQGTDETDLSHLEEVLLLHDLSRDKNSGGRESFLDRSKANFQNRCLHHHTFSLASISELVEHTGLKVIRKDYAYPYHNIVLAQKV